MARGKHPYPLDLGMSLMCDLWKLKAAAWSAIMILMTNHVSDSLRRTDKKNDRKYGMLGHYGSGSDDRSWQVHGLD